MIKAGTIWQHEGQQVEFVEDMRIGEPITCHGIKVDGAHPYPGSRVPRWMIWPDSIMRLTPPEGVTVVLPVDTSPSCGILRASRD